MDTIILIGVCLLSTGHAHHGRRMLNAATGQLMLPVCAEYECHDNIVLQADVHGPRVVDLARYGDARRGDGRASVAQRTHATHGTQLFLQLDLHGRLGRPLAVGVVAVDGDEGSSVGKPPLSRLSKWVHMH